MDFYSRLSGQLLRARPIPQSGPGRSRFGPAHTGIDWWDLPRESAAARSTNWGAASRAIFRERRSSLRARTVQRPGAAERRAIDAGFLAARLRITPEKAG